MREFAPSIRDAFLAENPCVPGSIPGLATTLRQNKVEAEACPA